LVSYIQGFVEDQFGLGLVARAAEEGIALLKPLGAMIFNMGGRPGQAVCQRLFERRGFHINKLWQTRVIQVIFTKRTQELDSFTLFFRARLKRNSSQKHLNRDNRFW
jgi:hypothetical protein